MLKRKTDQKDNRKDWVRHNEQIRIPQVLVVRDGQNLGVMTTAAALAAAREAGLDLVEVAPFSRPPVCQIMDYGKFMFDRSKKQAKQHSQKEKEVTLKYVIADHDLATKAGQITRFLAKGMRVRCVVFFQRREKAHKEQGFVILNRLLDLLREVSTVEQPPHWEGGNVAATVVPKKDKTPAKPAGGAP